MRLMLEKFIRPKQQKMGLSLLEEAEKARQEWLSAAQELNYLTDPDMLDHVIYKIKAHERRYVALLKQARGEKMAVWPKQLDNPVPELPESVPTPAPILHEKEVTG
ncbi:DUF2508 family protein [Desulfolucanica intricata]|uniref:DUF2508 family protein n=1 Tax=Desulfolucanica intricata TaxID=1285191 RepID=UPI00082C76D3|nr:DUF2508 family protein [Desulfolucanica intricata]